MMAIDKSHRNPQLDAPKGKCESRKPHDRWEIEDFSEFDFTDIKTTNQVDSKKKTASKKESSSSATKTSRLGQHIELSTGSNSCPASTGLDDGFEDVISRCDTERKSHRRSQSKRLKQIDNLEAQSEEISPRKSPSKHSSRDKSKHPSSPRKSSTHQKECHKERQSGDSETREQRRERRKEVDKSSPREDQKERCKESHGDRKKRSPLDRSRDDLFQDKEVADFLSLLEACAPMIQPGLEQIAKNEQRSEKTDIPRSELERIDKESHGKKSKLKSPTKEPKNKSDPDADKNIERKKHLVFKKSRNENNDAVSECDKSFVKTKSKPLNSERSSSLRIDDEEIVNKIPKVSQQDSSVQKGSPKKSKKKVEDGKESSSKDSSKSSGKDGMKSKHHKEDEKGEQEEVDTTNKCRRGSIAVWREQSKSRHEKDEDGHSRRQLKRSTCKSPSKVERNVDDDDDVDSILEAKVEAKKEERKKILEVSRSGPVRALSRRSSTRPNDDDTANLIFNLPLQSELDQQRFVANNPYMGGSGYLPAGLGGMASPTSEDGHIGRDPSRARRPSILCAADFSEHSEAADDDSVIRSPSKLRSRGNSGNMDGSMSSINSSFSKGSKFNSNSLVENLVIASAPVSKSANRRNQPLEGDGAIDNILKSRRLRGDNVAPRRQEKEEKKAKSKKFLFV